MKTFDPCPDRADDLLLLDSGGLSEAKRAGTEGHVTGCARCRDALGTLGDVQDTVRGAGGDVSEERYRAMIAALPPRAPVRRKWVRRALAAGLVAAIFGGGVVTGSLLDGMRSRTDRHRDRLLVASSEGAGVEERLAALAGGVGEGEDPVRNTTLLTILNRDPSVNVRLAVVDALYTLDPRYTPRGSVAASLIHQPSPVIRHAVIDYLASRRVVEALDLLRVVAEEDSVPAVREHARWALDQISKAGGAS